MTARAQRRGGSSWRRSNRARGRVDASRGNAAMGTERETTGKGKSGLGKDRTSEEQTEQTPHMHSNACTSKEEPALRLRLAEAWLPCRCRHARRPLHPIGRRLRCWVSGAAQTARGHTHTVVPSALSAKSLTLASVRCRCVCFPRNTQRWLCSCACHEGCSACRKPIWVAGLLSVFFLCFFLLCFSGRPVCRSVRLSRRGAAHTAGRQQHTGQGGREGAREWGNRMMCALADTCLLRRCSPLCPVCARFALCFCRGVSLPGAQPATLTHSLTRTLHHERQGQR
jgi:hypothetical protein